MQRIRLIGKAEIIDGLEEEVSGTIAG